jgi:ABC-type antimicrobial peptide transport system permease subunit
MEAITLTIIAILTSVILLSSVLIISANSLSLALGVSISTTLISDTILYNMGWVLLSVILSTSIPAWNAYKNNLQSNLQR